MLTHFVRVAIPVAVCAPLTVAQFLPPLLPEQSNISRVPEISISIPSNVRSESLQGQYFLVGTFGGSGGYINAQPGVSSYRIEAGVKGTTAKQVKLVLYANGCQTQKLIITVKSISEDLDFDCEPLPTVTLRGVVTQFNAFGGRDVQIEFNYMASWACGFFGLVDCLVTTFKVATVIPQSDGSFSVVLPDFTQDRNEKTADLGYKGQFNVIVRERRYGNTLAFLRPREFPPSEFLPVQTKYPTLLQFESKQ